MSLRHFHLAPDNSLKTIASAVLRDRQPLVLVVLRRTGEGTFDRIGCSDVPPVLGREVVESQQSISVLDQAFDRLGVLGAVGLEEEVEGVLGIHSGLGHPDVLASGTARGPPAPTRRDRLRAMLADLKMPGALEAVDGILSEADGGTISAAEAIEQLLNAQIVLRNNRRLQTAMRSGTCQRL